MNGNSVSTNAKAIADLRAEIGGAITRIGITLKEEQTKNAIIGNCGKFQPLGPAEVDSIQDLVLEIDNKLNGYDESTNQKLRVSRYSRNLKR